MSSIGVDEDDWESASSVTLGLIPESEFEESLADMTIDGRKPKPFERAEARRFFHEAFAEATSFVKLKRTGGQPSASGADMEKVRSPCALGGRRCATP